MAKHLLYLLRVKRIGKRFQQLRKRIKALLILSFILYITVISQVYAAGWVYPNTRLENSDIAKKTKRDIERDISAVENLTYEIRVKNRSYSYTYNDLGVLIDKDTLMSDVFAPNNRQFPINALLLLKSLFVKRTVTIPLVFTTDFYQFMEHTVFDFGQGEDNILFDPAQKSLTYVENEERYRIDEAYFVELLRERLGDNSKPLYPKLTKVVNEKAQMVATTSERIRQLFLSPLTVIVETSGMSESFLLSEKELAQLATTDLNPDQTSVEIGVNHETFTQIINDHVKKLRLLTRGNVATPKVEQDLREVFQARFDGHTVDAVTIGLDNGPNTTGATAKKYIEVDISQQKMYLFENGKLYKTFRVSTGLEYPTPTGEFTILNKAGLGYSRIYNVWMAYWMGFYLDPKLHAYFGIHELPYKLTNGQKIQRPANFIGQPNTGGCVALGVGDATVVYRFADIGTPVVIYN